MAERESAASIAHRIEVESNFLNGKYTARCACGWVGGSSWFTLTGALDDALTEHVSVMATKQPKARSVE